MTRPAPGFSRRWSIAVLVGVTLAAAVPLTVAGAAAPIPAPALPAIHAAPDPAGGRFVDAAGREVILRGVNVNSLVRYWRYGEFKTTFPLTRSDADLIAAQGWNVVRLAVSWSRIEPRPGRYSEHYLNRIARAVELFASRGVYTLIDLHQDAWGPTLAARRNETCPAGTSPAFGWDGAPAWATLSGGASRCALAGIRETSPAVLAAFVAFWTDAPARDGIGVRTRYAAMLGYVARRFAGESAVVGYDLMNEPNAFSAPQLQGLSDLAGAALAEIRRNEREVGGFAHILFVEPAPLWPVPGFVPPDFARDDQVAFAPHIYNGGLTSGPIPPQDFVRARTDAAAYGNAPVLVGEWGGDPRRADDPTDGYFADHQARQDAHRLSSTLWTWRESCGDPHKAGDARTGTVPYVWGEFDVDCTTNTVTGTRDALLGELRRGSVRAAPGSLVGQQFDPALRRLLALGIGAGAGVALEAFVPAAPGSVVVQTGGLHAVEVVAVDGGASVRALADGGVWLLVAQGA